MLTINNGSTIANLVNVFIMCNIQNTANMETVLQIYIHWLEAKISRQIRGHLFNKVNGWRISIFSMHASPLGLLTSNINEISAFQGRKQCTRHVILYIQQCGESFIRRTVMPVVSNRPLSSREKSFTAQDIHVSPYDGEDIQVSVPCSCLSLWVVFNTWATLYRGCLSKRQESVMARLRPEIKRWADPSIKIRYMTV